MDGTYLELSHDKSYILLFDLAYVLRATINIYLLHVIYC